MGILYTDTGSFLRAEVTGSMSITGSSNLLSIKGSGQNILVISGSNGSLLEIGESLTNSNDFFTIESGSINVFTIGRNKDLYMSGSLTVSGSITGSLFGTASFALSSAGGGGGGTTWSEITSTSTTMAVNNGYIANNVGLVTLTLPTTAALGSIIEVVGKGAGGWKIAQNTGEQIHFGNINTTSGTGGYLQSTLTYDAIRIVCTVTDNEWTVLSVQGNITII